MRCERSASTASLSKVSLALTNYPAQYQVQYQVRTAPRPCAGLFLFGTYLSGLKPFAMNIRFVPARTDSDLLAILQLQRANLPENISAEEAAAQGFVTVRHDLGILREMNEPDGHATAWADGELAGYALVMPRAFRDRIPILQPMFDRIDAIAYDGRQLGERPYIIMGQVAVAKPYRGQGIFAGLYEDLARRLAPHFDWLITEVATRNTRSRRAHTKVGFEDLLLYTAPDAEEWVIVGLNLKGA